ncbi:MATE family efflux transporter [Liquorilactobacillus satsumensis]|uniref:MATE family efflux transporter n=1 Tax=Liquorilactobacillus satsumensis TaxID=259059 RepID=UPI001E446B87|nr:MATE family efflux transporter [Liquorilactobacillus satsumensis]MCC7666705.1 MATE family efflux transporter [Liquorilactobacillus satsumensis]MCP9312676.1 MATE family efflux transporter [Liquorilactobacillus satsumensis]MCP9357581.1 MATE family efflux transporter [Liquorilactobacillus satsumensis]MCP9359862.1 MATE family efflux transporter [Liquorilactobacillus satsumensis]MCP9371875.1 MATE family efflux transporter [Liquorilactobacillus satsumensis]
MRELTKGNPIKLILMFTIPLLIGNLFQQFYSISDTLIVGQTLGVKELAAVGSTGSIQFLIIGFAQGLTAGLSIITAQYFGAGDYKKVRESFAASIIISVIVTLILTFLSLFYIKDILVLMQTPKEIEQDAQLFISIIFAGIFSSMAFNLLANVIRALGDSRTPLYFLIIAAMVNIVLELFFILVLNMGVEGAGYATVLAQVFSVFLCIVYIIKRIPLLQVRRKDFKAVTPKELKRHLYVGLPMAFQTSIIAIGAIMIQAALNGLGTTAVAATTAAEKIDQVAIQPMMSFGVAMATFTAQNYGAGKYERIIKGVKQCLVVSGLFSIVAGALVLLFGRDLVVLFVGSSEVEVLNLAQVYFNANCTLYLLLATLFVLRYTLQGLGQSVIPTIAGTVELLMRCLAALFLASSVGYVGACFANPLAWLGSCSVLIFSYFKAMRMLRQKEDLATKTLDAKETLPESEKVASNQYI